jgi:hypothetical protein
MGRQKKPLKTIYFTNGHATEEHYAEAEEIGPGVVFRRADLIVEGDPIEVFDAVAGDVPPVYQAAADAKAGKEPAPEAPKADPAAVKPGSPVKPPAKPAGGDAGGGWKPNA